MATCALAPAATTLKASVLCAVVSTPLADEVVIGSAELIPTGLCAIILYSSFL